MSQVNSRRKGRSGEQEIVRILKDELGLEITRNWAEQAHHGGVDILGLPGYAVEVKRAKEYSNRWFEQALSQANDTIPVLLYRLDRSQWKCEMRGCDLIKELKFEIEEQVTLSIQAFCTIVRERMNGGKL